MRLYGTPRLSPTGVKGPTAMVRRIPQASLRQAATRQDVIIVAAVIGSVIVLAVTILLPAWPRRPGNARQVVCLSNLKQAGQGLLMYGVANKGFVPIASSPGERGWVGVVASETGLLKRTQTHAADANQFPLGKWELFHCPERTGRRPDAFLDYVSNGVDPNGPNAAGEWGDPRARKYLKLGSTSRSSDTVLLTEAEHEAKVVDFKGVPSVKTAHEQWTAGPPTWNQGGVHAMTVWKGGHLPQGKHGINVDDKPGPRMVARGMHPARSPTRSSFLFQDDHVEAKGLFTRQNDEQHYAEWLKLFGVKNPTAVAQADSDLH